MILASLLIILIAALKHISAAHPLLSDFTFVSVVLFQVFVTYWLSKDESGNDESAWRDLGRVFILSVAVFPLFWLSYDALQNHFAEQNGMRATFTLALKGSFFTFILGTAVVSYAEETFYRGYLQKLLLKKWPVALTFIVTNLFFALGHFVGDYSPSRLLTFFPGLLFSYLVWRSNSIMGAVVFHGLCNIFAEVLRESYIWK